MNVKQYRQIFYLALFLCLLIPLLTFLPQSRAAPLGTHIVTTSADSGPGSLRQVIAGSAGGDVITFDPALSGQTIYLQSTLVIDKNLTIDGQDRAVTISGDSDADGDGDVRIIEGSITLKSLTIDRGYTDGNGGGILGYVKIYNSTVSNNVADGSGGGVYGGDYGGVYIYQSTFSGNEAGDSGGAVFGSGIRAENSTFYGNKARCTGGLANFLEYNDVTLAAIGVRNSTFSHNVSTDPCGIAIDSDASFGEDSKVLDTIIANGIGPGREVANCVEPGGWEGNLIEDGSCRAAFSGDPLLGPLQDNGGPTASMAPQPGSQAIDAANIWYYQEILVDQRGIARPQDGLGDGSARSDIGAYEVEAGQYPNLVQNGFLNEDLLHWQMEPAGSWLTVGSVEENKFMVAQPMKGYKIFQDGLAIEMGADYRACSDHFTDTINSYTVKLQLVSPSGENLGLNRALTPGDQCFDFQAAGSTVDGRFVLFFSQLPTPGTTLSFDDLRLYRLENEPAPAKGMIIIEKTADPAVDTLFNFSGDLGRFLLQDPRSPQRTFADLEPGQYRIREEPLSNCWYQSGLACKPAVAADINGPEVTIDLAAGSTVTCTYINSCALQEGEELLLNGGFDERLMNWLWYSTPTWVIIKKDGSNKYVKAYPWNGYAFYQNGVAMAAGPHEACLDVLEKSDPNTTISFYAFKTESWWGPVRSHMVAPGIGRRCAGFEVPEAWENARLAIIFDGIKTPGTSISFDNVSLRPLGGTPPKTGTITIEKMAIPADNTSFSFSGDLGSFTLQDPVMKSKTFTELEPGQFLIREEDLPDPWSFSGVSCQPEDAATISGQEATINLFAGSSVTCTFVNTSSATTTPTSTSTPTNTVTPTPDYTTTPTATGTPSPTMTPSPTATPQATITPSPTAENGGGSFIVWLPVVVR